MTTVAASSIEPVLEKLCEPFGGLAQLRPRLSQSQLEYIALFPGFSTIAKPWAKEVNLSTKGFRPGTPYRVFDRDFRFLYEVCPPVDEPMFGLDERDLKELTFRHNGDYLHVQFVGTEGPNCGLIWIQNQIPPQLAKQQISSWLAGIEIQTPRQTDHELFASTSLLASDKGRVAIYFVPGTWEEQLSATNILIDKVDKAILTYREAGDPLVFYPNRSGWYVFLQEDSFGVRTFLTLADQYGIGSRRMRRVEDAFFFQAQNADLAPSIPDATQAIGNTGTLNWASSDPRMRIEAKLDYARIAFAVGSTLATAIGDVNYQVPCDDILASESFGGSNFLDVNEHDAEDFLGNSFAGIACSVTSAGTAGGYGSSKGSTLAVANGDADFSLDSYVVGETRVEATGYVSIDGDSVSGSSTGATQLSAAGGTYELAEENVEDAGESTYASAIGQVLVTGAANVQFVSLVRVLATEEEEDLPTTVIGKTEAIVSGYSELSGASETYSGNTAATAIGNVTVSSSPASVEGTSASAVEGVVIMKSNDATVVLETLASAVADNSVPSDPTTVVLTSDVISGSEVVHVARSRRVIGSTTAVASTAP